MAASRAPDRDAPSPIRRRPRIAGRRAPERARARAGVGRTRRPAGLRSSPLPSRPARPSRSGQTVTSICWMARAPPASARTPRSARPRRCPGPLGRGTRTGSRPRRARWPRPAGRAGTGGSPGRRARDSMSRGDRRPDRRHRSSGPRPRRKRPAPRSGSRSGVRQLASVDPSAVAVVVEHQEVAAGGSERHLLSCAVGGEAEHEPPLGARRGRLAGPGTGDGTLRATPLMRAGRDLHGRRGASGVP